RAAAAPGPARTAGRSGAVSRPAPPAARHRGYGLIRQGEGGDAVGAGGGVGLLLASGGGARGRARDRTQGSPTAQPSCRSLPFMSVMSTRRFKARLAGVSFAARGWVSAWPLT